MRILFTSCLIALAFLFQSCNDQAEQTSQVDFTENDVTPLLVKQDIAPAFANINVAAQHLTVKGSDAQTLKLSSGSSIDVPAAAFVDANGTPVKGNVDITFREFHNAAEIIASGIPMKVFKQNGKEEWMQTAGMYEINGTQNGQPVFVAPGKTLNVNLISEVDGEYDFWKFDEGSGDWDNLGISTPQPNPNATIPQNAPINIGPPPVAPIAFNQNTPPIDLEVNLKNFPELADKQGIVWQYAGKDAQKDPANNRAIFQNSWDEIDLQANEDGQTYTLTLENDDEKITLPVVPTLKGKDLEQALADYQQRLNSYQKKLASASEVSKLKKQQASFIRSYSIEGFGIFNYDILTKMDNTIPILANFDFGIDLPANMRKDIVVFQISGNGKMVVKFPPSDWKKFRLDPELKPSLVAVLPGNQLATLTFDDIKKQLPQIKAASGQEYIFRMEVQADEVKSLQDVEDRLVAL